MCPDLPELSKDEVIASPLATSSQSTYGPPRGLVHKCVAIEDSEYEDILSRLPEAVNFIREALDDCESQSIPGQRNKVLVHCVMGISRSSTVVCAYRTSWVT